MAGLPQAAWNTGRRRVIPDPGRRPGAAPGALTEAFINGW